MCFGFQFLSIVYLWAWFDLQGLTYISTISVLKSQFAGLES